MQSEQHQYTVAGTDIEDVKRKNAASGMSYKEVKENLASTDGKNTKMFSDTNIDKVKGQIHRPN